MVHALNWTCEGQGLWVGNKQRRREECHLQRLRAKAGVGLSPAAPFLRPFPASSCWSLPLSITPRHSYLPTPFLLASEAHTLWVSLPAPRPLLADAVSWRPRGRQGSASSPFFSLYKHSSDELIYSHSFLPSSAAAPVPWASTQLTHSRCAGRPTELGRHHTGLS